MEMLNPIVSTAILGFLAWLGISMVDLKTETAVIAVKVDQNHKMLVELWDYYLQERVNGDIAWVTRKPDIQTTAETKVD
tara:strand:- start:68 stop:304 length:237 start_codon:yes stop_codon:yes gene_type:complete